MSLFFARRRGKKVADRMMIGIYGTIVGLLLITSAQVGVTTCV